MSAPLRLCIFGNSHIAALKEAHVADPARWPGLEVTFVGAHEGLLLETEIENGRLLPVTDAARHAFRHLNRCTSVDLTAYDAFAIAGALSLEVVVQLYREMRTTAFVSAAASGDLASEAFALVSAPLALAACVEALLRRVGPRLAQRLRSVTDWPICLLTQPRATARLLRERDVTTVTLRHAHKAGDAAALARLFEAACDMVAAAVGADVLAQPADTLHSPILTRPAWMHGGPRLTSALRTAPFGDPVNRQPGTDVRHANAAYGARVLDQIAAASADVKSEVSADVK